MVLSRQEIDAVLAHLAHPYKLIAQLQYGCGLRVTESVTLRAKDFNFDAGMLTVRGKGHQDHDDLSALSPAKARKRSEESAGFLSPWVNML